MPIRCFRCNGDLADFEATLYVGSLSDIVDMDGTMHVVHSLPTDVSECVIKVRAQKREEGPNYLFV